MNSFKEIRKLNEFWHVYKAVLKMAVAKKGLSYRIGVVFMAACVSSNIYIINFWSSSLKNKC